MIFLKMAKVIVSVDIKDAQWLITHVYGGVVIRSLSILGEKLLDYVVKLEPRLPGIIREKRERYKRLFA